MEVTQSIHKADAILLIYDNDVGNKYFVELHN